MHKTTLIFGSAVLASVVVSLLIVNFWGKPSSLQQNFMKQNPNTTTTLLIPLNDKNLTNAYITYNLKTTIQKVELTAKGTVLHLGNNHMKKILVTLDTNITSAVPGATPKVMALRDLAKDQQIKIAIRQNLINKEDISATQIIVE